MTLVRFPVALPVAFFVAATAVLALGNPAMAREDHAEAVSGVDTQGNEKVNELIIFGNDACPPSTADEITVCARKDESERYRIPAPLRDNPTATKNEAWAQRVRAYETVGNFGTNSCSPVGAGGATGCMSQLIHAAYAERKQSSDVQFGKLIEAERAKRLQTIDADAAAEQSRVEQLEREYDAKLKRESEDNGTAATPAPTASSPAPAPHP